jgi:hypothetical protein
MGALVDCRQVGLSFFKLIVKVTADYGDINHS